LASAAEGASVGIGGEEVQAAAAEAGEVFRTVVLAVAGLVVVHDDIKGPVEAAFNMPVGPDDVGKRPGGEGFGERVIASHDLADGLKARKVVSVYRNSGA